MCEIITMGRRLAHARSLTYRFWGDASREESLFGVTPRARRHPKKCEASPQKMRGVTPKNARRHPKKCEASPQRLRGVTPKMEGWPLTSFSKITIFQKQRYSLCMKVIWGTTITEEQTIPVLPVFVLL